MFDANMKYLPKGFKFFAEVEGAVKILANLGLKCGDIVQCHMLNESEDNPCVDLLINGKITTVQNYKKGQGWYDRLVYSGNLDGSGFIEEERYHQAKLVARDNGNPFTVEPDKKFYIPCRNKKKLLGYIKAYGSDKPIK